MAQVASERFRGPWTEWAWPDTGRGWPVGLDLNDDVAIAARLRDWAAPRQAALAIVLYDGVVDKAGQPMLRHARRVVLRHRNRWPGACDPHEVAAAYLHDTIEDAPGVSAETLLRAGTSLEAIGIVSLLTRRPGQPYGEYLLDIARSGCLPAMRIKLADLADNMDPMRSPRPVRIGSLMRRYQDAAAVLEALLQAEAVRQGVPDARSVAP